MKRTPIKPKPKKCTECGTEFMPFKSTDKTCANLDCKTAWALKVVRKQKANDWKVEKKAIREKLKTLSEYEAEAKTFFQKFIRMRDANKGCISCGIEQTTLWDGGHWKKAEIYSGLIFDERNCHKQCRKCNRYLGGNEGEYRIGLVNRFGEDFVKQLESDANERRNCKYTKEELIEIKNKYLKKIKELSLSSHCQDSK